jgi:hypothetical protein
VDYSLDLIKEPNPDYEGRWCNSYPNTTSRW